MSRQYSFDSAGNWWSYITRSESSADDGNNRVEFWRPLKSPCRKKQFYYQIYIGILSNMVWNARIILDYRNLSAYNLTQVWSKPIFQFSRKSLIFSIFFKKRFCPFTRLKPFLILRHPVVIVMRKNVILEIHNSRYCYFKLCKIYCGFKVVTAFWLGQFI